MAEAVKISDLPDASSFGSEDLFVVNDITGADEITSKISVGSVVNWITSQDLKFTGTLEVGNIVPGDEGFNVTVNSIFIKDQITISPFADVDGLELDDLDDVEIDTDLLAHGQLLMWDSVDSVWANDFLEIDNNTGALIEINNKLDNHAQAILDLEIKVKRLENTMIEEAPFTNTRYARINGTWQETDYLVPDDGTVDVIPPPPTFITIGTPTITRVSGGDLTPNTVHTFEVSAPGMGSIDPILIQWTTVPNATISNQNSYRASITFSSEGQYTIGCRLSTDDSTVTDSPQSQSLTINVESDNDPNSLNSMFDRTYINNAIRTDLASHRETETIVDAWTDAMDIWDRIFKLRPELVSEMRKVDANFNGIKFDYELIDSSGAWAQAVDWLYINYDEPNIGSQFCYKSLMGWGKDKYVGGFDGFTNYGGLVESAKHEIGHVLGVSYWWVSCDQANEWWGDRPSWHKPFWSGQATESSPFLKSPGYPNARSRYVADGGSTGGVPALAAAGRPEYDGNYATGFAHWAGYAPEGQWSYNPLNTDIMSYGMKQYGNGPGNAIGGATWGMIKDTGNFIELSGPEGSSIDNYASLINRYRSFTIVPWTCETADKTHDSMIQTFSSVHPDTGAVTTTTITPEIRASRGAAPLRT